MTFDAKVEAVRESIREIACDVQELESKAITKKEQFRVALLLLYHAQAAMEDKP